MIPVKQTRSGDGKGNCWAASAASILELKLNQVPRKTHGDDWLDNWRRWLGKRGLSVEWFKARKKAPKGWAILSVFNSHGNTHAVVCYDGQVMHDPYDGDIEWASAAKKSHWYVFTVLNPQEMR